MRQARLGYAGFFLVTVLLSGEGAGAEQGEDRAKVSGRAGEAAVEGDVQSPLDLALEELEKEGDGSPASPLDAALAEASSGSPADSALWSQPVGPVNLRLIDTHLFLFQITPFRTSTRKWP